MWPRINLNPLNKPPACLWSGWLLQVHTTSSSSSHYPFGTTVKVWNLLSIMTHFYNPSAWEEEEGELEVEGLPGLDELPS